MSEAMIDFDRWNNIKVILLLLTQKLEYRVLGYKKSKKK
jgi:hypothetical protein